MGIKKGFTLIELMIAAAILCTVGLTIVVTFAGGLKVYYKMKNYGSVKTDALLAMEKIERDIRNAFAFTDINFIGTSDKITFPALVKSYAAKNKPYMSVGSISYFIDDRHSGKKIAREEKSYSASLMKEEKAKRAVAHIADIEDMDLQYYVYDPLSDTYSWEASWDKTEEIEQEKEDPQSSAELKDARENVPLGVRVTLTFDDNGKKFILSRVIFMEPVVSFYFARARAAEKAGEETQDAE